jgi:hypothetical protein
MSATSMGVTLSISKTCTNSIGEQKYFRKVRTIIGAVKAVRELISPKIIEHMVIWLALG